jgi:hypothetical protein
LIERKRRRAPLCQLNWTVKGAMCAVCSSAQTFILVVPRLPDHGHPLGALIFQTISDRPVSATFISSTR